MHQCTTMAQLTITTPCFGSTHSPTPALGWEQSRARFGALAAGLWSGGQLCDASHC